MSQSQYATKADLLALSITPEFATQLPDAAINLHLQAASSKADLYLHSQFDLPLVSWDAGLTECVCNIAAYTLLCQYGFNPNAPENQVIRQRANDSMSLLNDISTQRVTPTYVGTGNATGSAGPFVRKSHSPIGFAETPHHHNWMWRWWT